MTGTLERNPQELLREGRQALSEGRLADAAIHAEHLLALRPHDLRSQLFRGELLDAQRKRPEAVAHYADLRSRWPRDPWVLGRLIGALAASGDMAAATSLYRTELADSTASEAEKTHIARRLAAANRAHPEAAAILASRLQWSPDDAALLREIGSSMLANGRIAEALGHLGRSAELAPLPAWTAALRLNALAEHRRLGGIMPVVDTVLLGVLRDALTRFPADPLFVRHLNRLPIPLHEWTDLYARVREDVARVPVDGLLRFELAKACLQAGDTAEARLVLEELEPGSHWARVARPLRDVLDAIPPATWRRARLRDDPAAELQIVPSPGARRTLIVFATLTGNFMMLPLAGIDALLADQPTNIVFVRDTALASCLSGLRSVGGDLLATIGRLAHIVGELGAPHLVTMGGSVSGLAAIRYGARLGAARAVTFGALTTVDPDFAGTPVRLQRTMRRMQKHASAAGSDRFGDVATELLAAPAMRVDLFVGADCPLDRQQAERLEGIRQIAIHREPGVDHHYVGLTLIARGRFAGAVTGEPR